MGKVKPRCGWEGREFVFRSETGFASKLTPHRGQDITEAVREDLTRWLRIARQEERAVDVANLEAAMRAEGMEIPAASEGES